MRMGALVLALALVVMASAVMADPINVDSVTEVNTYTYDGAASPAQHNVNAGTVYELNLNYQTKTTAWAGIFGKISGRYVLGDATHVMKEWAVSEPDGYIAIAYTQNINWSNVSGYSDLSTLYSHIFNEVSGWNVDADQNVDKTFESTAVDCNAAYGIDLASGNTYEARVAGSYDGTATYWPTCVYHDDSNHVVYATPVGNSGATAFNGSSAQYEAIVAASESGTTVFFFKG